ncbi:bleomycin resistance family protein [Cupriavidus gilardii]|nr:bleomycin resistance family protein [Cupriavidus gilardii]
MSLTLLLRCNNLQKTREFYESVLAFSVSASAENTITVEKYGCKLLFTEANLWNVAPALSGTMYFTVSELDDLYALVRDKVEVAWPLQNMGYGSREFGLTDCNGYLLAFQERA